MNTEELNALKERAYKTAVAHGFHEEEKPDAYWLGLVMSEMGEAINADRKGWLADAVLFNDDLSKMSFNDSFEAHIKDRVEDEIADVVIRLLDFAGMKGYTLLSSSGISINFSDALKRHFAENDLPGTLIQLISYLYYYSSARNRTERTIGIVINIISNCFDKMTGGSDCDLWWFVKQKMRYNEQRPMLNGKKY